MQSRSIAQLLSLSNKIRLNLNPFDFVAAYQLFDTQRNPKGLGAQQYFLISIFPNFFTSLMISISTFTFLIWGKLHGQRLTRKEVIFFDVANLLEINPKFEYESAKLGDECLTPGEVGKEVELPGPQTFWEALFFDERKFQMQKFYKEHYGPVYKTAQRKYAEYLMQVSIRFCGAARPDFKIHFLQQKEERERNGEKSVKKNE